MQKKIINEPKLVTKQWILVNVQAIKIIEIGQKMQKIFKTTIFHVNQYIKSKGCKRA
jgi:hypothetical protein